MHTKTSVRALLCVLLIGLLAGCGIGPASTATAQPPYWPGAEWRTSTPEAQGLDSALIASMLEEIRNEDLHVHSVLIVRHGYMVTEVYFPPYTRELKHPGYSITKSVTSAMTGIAIEEGLIQSVGRPVLDYFPEVAETTRDERLPEIKIEHLLTMSAGFNVRTLQDLMTREADFDAARSVLANRVQAAPGETFFYDTGLPHVLSTILQQRSGLTLEEYARRKLLGPMGITDLVWKADAQGITNGGAELGLLPQDMARLGYLYLHNGEWDGKQIVPAEWVEESTRLHMETKGLMDAAEDDGYGYYWWIDSWGGYSAHGLGGQYIFVLPKLDMVVVFTSGLSEADFPAPHELVKTYLLAAAEPTSALPADPDAKERLAEEIGKIQAGAGATAPVPEFASQISGKTFRLTGNPPGGWPTEITFDFPGDDTYINSFVWPGGERVTVTGGLNGLFYLNHGGQTLMAWRGTWRDEHTFVEEQNFDLASSADFVTVTYVFEGNGLSATVESGMGSFPTLHGTGQLIE